MCGQICSRQFTASLSRLDLSEFSGCMCSSSQAVARHSLRAVYSKCPTLVYSKELDYPARSRSHTWKDCQARLLSCKHKKPQTSTGHLECVGTVDPGKRYWFQWDIRHRRALQGLMQTVCYVMCLSSLLFGFCSGLLPGTRLVEQSPENRQYVAGHYSSESGLGSLFWFAALLVAFSLAAWRQCRSACDAALVFFLFPLAFSFCSLFLFMPLLGLAAVLAAEIRFCANWSISVASPERPKPTPKSWPSKKDKRLHRRAFKQLRQLTHRAKHYSDEKRAAIGSATCWMADCLLVCAVIVRVMIPLLAAILFLGLVDILLHIIVSTVKLGSS